MLDRSTRGTRKEIETEIFSMLDGNGIRLRLMTDAEPWQEKWRTIALFGRMYQELANLKVLKSAGGKVPQIFDDNTNKFEDQDTVPFGPQACEYKQRGVPFWLAERR